MKIQTTSKEDFACGVVKMVMAETTAMTIANGWGGLLALPFLMYNLCITKGGRYAKSY